MERHSPPIRYGNLHNARSYECTRNRVNVFEKGITLPGECSSDHAAPTAAIVRNSACGWRGCGTEWGIDPQSGFAHFLYTISDTDCKLYGA